MIIYSNCHAALEVMRTEAEKRNGIGPIALLAGPCDVGKSTLCRLLLNYAVRMGRRPIFVDLDVGQGQISVPGSVGALLIERPASLDSGFSQEAPLVYNFGYSEPNRNNKLYSLLYAQLAQTIKEKMEINKRSRYTRGRVFRACDD